VIRPLLQVWSGAGREEAHGLAQRAYGSPASCPASGADQAHRTMARACLSRRRLSRAPARHRPQLVVI